MKAHKYIVSCLCVMMLSVAMYGQTPDTLTLGYCFSEATKTYPLGKDKAILQEISELKQKNINASYLPQFTLNGQATYQSTAININMPLPNNPISISQSKDQYKATVDASQLIYDGGLTRSQRNLEKSTLAADQQQVEVDLYKVKEQINSTYFLILSLQETEKLLQTTLSDLTEKEKTVASSVKNGVLTESDLNNLQAEKLKVEQQVTETGLNKSLAIKILGLLMNKPIPENVCLALPGKLPADTTASVRPELELFYAQQSKLDAAKKLTESSVMPKISAFAQAGYGRPGLNMLDDNFNPFYIVGASAKWTLWDWGKNRRERQVLDVTKKSIDTKKETFNKNLDIDLQNKQVAISKLEEAIKRDSMIVELRSKVARVSASKLDNGVINTTDYLTDKNAEIVAKINLENHKIQLQQARVAYFIAKGITID